MTYVNRAFGAIAVLSAITAALAVASHSASAQDNVYAIAPVAITGEPAPGTGGLSFAHFGFADLNDSGLVAFHGNLSPALSNDEGIWLGTTDQLSLMVRTGDQVPGATARTFSQFWSVPLVNSAGEVAVGATCETGEILTPCSGIWVGSAGVLRAFVTTGDPAEGTQGDLFVDTSLQLFEDSGIISFWANTSGFGHGVWRGIPGAIDPVAKTGDPAPGTAGLAFYFVDGWISQNGDTALFFGNTDNPDFNRSQGIWAYGPGGVSAIAVAGYTAPGTGGRTFREFMPGGAAGAGGDPAAEPVVSNADIPRLNDTGDVAFCGYIDPVDPDNSVNWFGDHGIWLKDSLGLRLIALTGDTAPGTTGLQFRYFSHLDFNNSGQIAFSAGLTGAETVEDHGIWLGSPDNFDLIVREGDPAPGAPGETFGPFVLGPFLNDSGDIVFVGWLRESNSYGIWASNPGGGMVLLAREGEAVSVADGDYRQIDTIEIGIDYDGNNIFNDAGQLVFKANFTDGTSGLLLATPVGAANNLPPVADAGPDLSTPEGTAITIDGSGSFDPENTILSFVWSIGGVQVATGPQFSASSLSGGSHTITLTVTDRNGASASDNMILTVVPNLPPVANAGPDQTVSHIEMVTLDGSASSDPEGSSLTYVWSLNGSQIAAGTTATVGPFALGDHVITLTVTDDIGKSASDDMVVSVINNAPVANAGPDRNILTLQSVFLDGRASTDPEGEPLSYVWSLDGAQIAAGPTPTVGPFDTGVYTVVLTVTDGHGASASDETIVTVSNRAPLANAGPDQSANHAQTVTLDGTGSSDPEGSILSYAWTIDGAPIASGPTPIAGPFEVGVYTVTLTVTDDHGATATDSMVLSVINEAPVADAGPDQTVGVKGKTTTVTLDGSASGDPEGGALSYLWTLDGQNVGTDVLVQVQVPFGTHVFTLTVTDDHGATAADTVAVTVAKGKK